MSDLRAGERLKAKAIVLQLSPFGESDKIAVLLTQNHGRISSLARGAGRSIKRFGGALQTFQLVNAHLKQPRNHQMWTLESVDLLQDSPKALRYQTLESLSLASRVMIDFVPEGHSEPRLFDQTLLAMQMASDLDIMKLPKWAVLFWAWYAFDSGYGTLLSKNELGPLTEQFFQSEVDSSLWTKILNQQNNLPTLIIFYKRWVAQTGLVWDYFESWHSQSSLR